MLLNYDYIHVWVCRICAITREIIGTLADLTRQETRAGILHHDTALEDPYHPGMTSTPASLQPFESWVKMITRKLVLCVFQCRYRKQKNRPITMVRRKRVLVFGKWIRPNQSWRELPWLLGWHMCMCISYVYLLIFN